MPDPNELPLPDMTDAVLSPDQLAALFRDYRTCTGGIQILIKFRF
jgi:hypothetical protein